MRVALRLSCHALLTERSTSDVSEVSWLTPPTDAKDVLTLLEAPNLVTYPWNDP
jgi:hypothetical protein